MAFDVDSFQQLMGQAGDAFNQLDAAQASLTNQKYRDLFDNLISKGREAIEQAEATAPAVFESFKTRRAAVEAKANQLRDEAPEREKKRQELVEQVKQAVAKREEDKQKMKAKPPKVDLAKVKMPNGWGEQLKDELLSKFGHLPASHPAAHRDAAIWDDWNWGGDMPGGKGPA